MPLPTPNKDESQDDFISRCMGNPTMKSEFPDHEQRTAVCFSQWRGTLDVSNSATPGISITGGASSMIRDNVVTGIRSDISTLKASQASAVGAIREETLNDKDFLVIPVIALVEGVIQSSGSDQPELITSREIAAPIEAWNGCPVTLGHPEQNGHLTPIGEPNLVENFQIGTIFNAELKDDKLHVEAWLDLEKIEELGEEALSLLERVKNGEEVEVSTGYFAKSLPSEGVFNGDNYEAIQQNVKPDHLAILGEGAVGACSWDDGCGIPRLNQADKSFAESFQSVLFSRENWVSPADCHHWLEEKGLKDTFSLKSMTGSFRYNSRKAKDFQRVRTVCLEKVAGDCSVTAIEGLKKKTEASQRFFNRFSDTMTFEGNQEISDVDKRAAIAAALEANGEMWFSLAAVFDNFVVFERDWGKLFKQGYEIAEDGTVTLSDSAEPVRPVTEFVPIVINASSDAENMENVNMKKEEMIKSLIANEATRFVEEDRKFLEGLEEAQIEKLAPVEVKTEEEEGGGTKKVEEEDGSGEPDEVKASSETPPQTPEQFLETAPPEVREVLNESLQLREVKRNTFIEQLIANKNCEFSNEDLSAMPNKDLERLVRLMGVEADYSGQGGSTLKSQEDANAIPPTPQVFDLSKNSSEKVN